MMNENNLFEGLGLIDINTPAKTKEIEKLFVGDQIKIWNCIKCDFFAR